ncbi:MAG TPA: orotidine-5'-phosphate decarboxylase [Gemmatimonadaceae bacterium]|jgi:orotidine-5'-phosphate decarboxylase|nr:orotidine-5'-phosphate decarboxylase [Gemmatimonadaceae bacterium]
MKARAIVALDVPDASEADALLTRVGPAADFVKIGSELFTAAGPEIVSRMREERRDVFLDLKWHDIPTTVRNAARAAAKLDVRLVTVHASGGRAMLDAAVEGAGSACGVLAVTVLTSLDATALGQAWGRSISRVEDEVLRLAELAREAGAHGIVCSGAEAAAVRAKYGNTLRLLIPGIRLPGGDAHDQARVVTPEAALNAGASYLVLGRAVTAATDPREALTSVKRALEA